jgi:hypothetical protein
MANAPICTQRLLTKPPFLFVCASIAGSSLDGRPASQSPRTFPVVGVNQVDTRTDQTSQRPEGSFILSGRGHCQKGPVPVKLCFGKLGHTLPQIRTNLSELGQYHRPNENKGAESALSYLLGLVEIRRFKRTAAIGRMKPLSKLVPHGVGTIAS